MLSSILITKGVKLVGLNFPGAPPSPLSMTELTLAVFELSGKSLDKRDKLNKDFRSIVLSFVSLTIVGNIYSGPGLVHIVGSDQDFFGSYFKVLHHTFGVSCWCTA